MMESNSMKIWSDTIAGSDVWSRIGDAKLRKSLDKESLRLLNRCSNIYQVPLPLRETARMGQIYSYLNAENSQAKISKKLFGHLYDQELLDLGELVGLEEFEEK